MPARTRLTVEISERTHAGLEQLAGRYEEETARLAAEAPTSYVEQELDTVRGIEAGLSDLHHERVLAHGDAMAEISVLINAARTRKA